MMLFTSKIRSTHFYLAEAAPAARTWSCRQDGLMEASRNDLEAALAERCVR
jgi:hypothetical protein